MAKIHKKSGGSGMIGLTWNRGIDLRRSRKLRAAAWVFTGLFLALSALGTPVHSHAEAWTDPAVATVQATAPAPAGAIVCSLCLFAHNLHQLVFPVQEHPARTTPCTIFIAAEESGCIGTKISFSPSRAPPLGATIFAS